LVKLRINITAIEFIKLLELIGTKFGYDDRGNINDYKLPPHDGVAKLETLQKKIEFLRFKLGEKAIQIPPNLSILGHHEHLRQLHLLYGQCFQAPLDWEFCELG
jgi:hypothetical protein